MADQENTASAAASADAASVMTDQHEANHDEGQSAFDDITSGTQVATRDDKSASDTPDSDARYEDKVKTTAEAAKDKEKEQEKAAIASTQALEREKVVDIFPIVETYHPGARAKAATAEFQGWLNTLPKHYQDMIDRGDPVEAAMLLDMYDKESKGLPAPPADAKKLEEASVAAPVFSPLTFDAVKDLKIKDDDGNDITLAEFANEYGQIGNVALAIANQVVQSALKSLPQQQNHQVITDYLKKAELDSFKAQIDSELFENRVERMYPGAVKKVTSDGFKAYLKQASPMQVKLFTHGGTDDVVAVLNEFDRVQAIEEAKSAQRKQGEKKKALDSLHGNSLHSNTSMDRAKKPEETAVSGEQAEIEARESFDAALQKIENERRRK
mgnify:CR=1 FL=1